MSEAATLRILLVDDEAGIRQGLGDLLRTHGHEVRTADSVDRALDELRRGPVDLLITDLKMEGGDGLDLVRTARQIDPDLAAMVVTGYASLEVALEAVRLGLIDLIEKPFRARRVLEAVASCHRRQRAVVEEDGTFSIPLDRSSPSAAAGHAGVLLALRGFRNPARAEVQTAAAQVLRTVVGEHGIGGEARIRVEGGAREARVAIDVPAATFMPVPEGQRILDVYLDELRREDLGDRTVLTLVRSGIRRDPDVCRVRPEDAEADLEEVRARIAASGANLPVELDVGECEALSAEALCGLEELILQSRAAGREIEIVHAPVTVRRAAAALGLDALAGPGVHSEHLIRNTLWS